MVFFVTEIKYKLIKNTYLYSIIKLQEILQRVKIYIKAL